jgi:phosphoserine phosphatase RsbU/P
MSTTARPVLGVLVDNIEEPYQNELLVALMSAAHRREADLFCFAGGTLEPDAQWGGPRNRIYDVASPDNVAAIVVSSASLESRVGSSRLAVVLERFASIPCCSIGVVLPGWSTVLVDNGAGMRGAVMHLVEEHGLRRIAFVRGPEANEEAEQRFQGYRAALQERQIAFDPALVVPGDFLVDSGARAIRTLIEERLVAFDAVAAASDQMALGAMAELEARGRRVPDAVAVVGFDDEISARYAARPLTTVRQPIPAQAAEAVQIVLRQLRGGGEPTVSKLHTELVIRRSCGCLMEREAIAAARSSQPGSCELDPTLGSRRMPILIEMLAAAPELSGTKWADRLFDAFVIELQGDAGDSLTGVLDDLVGQVEAAGLDPRLLQPVLSSLRRGAIPSLIQSPTLLLQAETALHEARVLLSNLIHHRDVKRRLEEGCVARVLSSLAQALIAATDLDSFLESLALHLPGVGIPSCYVSVYPGTLPGAELRLLFGYDSRRTSPIARRDATFPATELAPRDLLPVTGPRAFVVQPLFFGDRSLGVALFEWGPHDGAVYESLRGQISAALQRVTR